jgi:hypothetical protein
MRTKLAILRLRSESLKESIQATLTIKNTSQPDMDILVDGELPANTDLADMLNQWQSHYRRLNPARVQPGTIYVDEQQECLNFCRELEPKLRLKIKDWMESDPFRPIRDKCLAELTNVEVLFVVHSQCQELLRIPWHLWDLIENNKLAEISLSASEVLPIASENIPTRRGKVRILAILGSSEGIDIQKDCQILNDIVDTEITFLSEPQLSEIDNPLWEYEWDILFFAGHSRTDGEDGIIAINQTDSLKIDDLKYALEKAINKGLKLAIFNSCDGLGLAFQLQELQLPHSIVMREYVNDGVATGYV